MLSLGGGLMCMVYAIFHYRDYRRMLRFGERAKGAGAVRRAPPKPAARQRRGWAERLADNDTGEAEAPARTLAETGAATTLLTAIAPAGPEAADSQAKGATDPEMSLEAIRARMAARMEREDRARAEELKLQRF
ncbi:hypothetical protein AB2M62_02760 [Sphingomonas sp. MMS12-HWE2-04]|uniref:hypothetical protein n=1 Tax=Sphingomonas sp. MMS12-HWE2-04 TaxID=3234199 RepID=UPI003850269E